MKLSKLKLLKCFPPKEKFFKMKMFTFKRRKKRKQFKNPETRPIIYQHFSSTNFFPFKMWKVSKLIGWYSTNEIARICFFHLFQDKKSKVGDHSREWPEGSLFNSLLHQGVGEGGTPYLGLLHFTLDPYLIMLSVKQGGIKYHFLSLWYDSTWDWTRSPRPLANTLTARPISGTFFPRWLKSIAIWTNNKNTIPHHHQASS